jgi:hypothetical protein
MMDLLSRLTGRFEVSNINFNCFLCGSATKTTQEHVFPKWLQNRFNLWNESVVLKNGTKIRYKDLKIPCCSDCNTKHLSRIEGMISAITDTGVLDELKANSETLFVWLYKIMYGINYKELFLVNDRRDVDSEPIVTLESHGSRRSYNMFLMHARNELFFDGFVPYSLFVFHLSDSSREIYFFASEPYKLFATAIIGNFGIVVSFQDDGYIAAEIEKANILNGRSELSILEFCDFSTFILHLKVRMKMLPDYEISVSNSPASARVRIQPLPEGPRFEEFNPALHADLFQKLFRQWLETNIVKNGVTEVRYSSPFRYF